MIIRRDLLTLGIWTCLQFFFSLFNKFTDSIIFGTIVIVAIEHEYCQLWYLEQSFKKLQIGCGNEIPLPRQHLSILRITYQQQDIQYNVFPFFFLIEVFVIL